MSIAQWLLLILIIAVVAGAYWYLRRHAGSDPWAGMDDDPADDPSNDGPLDEAIDRGEALGGDSYIVGVRTLSNDTPASRRASQGAGVGAWADDDLKSEQISDDAAEASWQAYKKGSAEPPEDDSAPAEPAPPSVEKSREPQPDRPTPASTPTSKPTGASSEPARDRRTSEPERVDNIRPPRAPADGDQKIFILHVASPDGHFFDGPDVHAALQSQELKFGLNDLYHRVTETNGVPESVFSVANMLKPGTLDPVDQDHLATPGLTFFLILPGAIEGVPAMREMMVVANRVSQRLGGEVLDDKRALLKAQTAQYMLDQIADLDRRAQIAKRR